MLLAREVIRKFLLAARAGGPRSPLFASCRPNVGAPPFAVFEGWESELSTNNCRHHANISPRSGRHNASPRRQPWVSGPTYTSCDRPLGAKERATRKSLSC